MTVHARLLPSTDRPSAGLARAGLILLLLADAILIAFVPKAIVLLSVLAAMAALAWLTRDLPVSIAMVAVGYPILDPVCLAIGDNAPVFYALRAALAVGLVLFVLARVRMPGRLAARLAGDSIPLLAAAMGVVLAIGLFYTPTPIYGRAKFLSYLATNILLLLGGFVLARGHDLEPAGLRDERLDRFWKAVVVFAALISLVGLVNWWTHIYKFRSRLDVLNVNSIWIGRIMGIGVIGLLTLRDARRLGWVAIACVTVPLVVVMVMAGARGPIIGLFLAATVWGFAHTPASGGRRLRLLLAMIAAAGVLLVVMPENVRDRFVKPITGEASDYARLGMAKVVEDALAKVPFQGLGTGGFPDLIRGGDRREYPHNIVAEIGIENGIPGLIVLFAFFWVVLRRAGKRKSDPRMFASLLAFLFALWNAQFSGDIFFNEWLWLFAGVIAGRSR